MNWLTLDRKQLANVENSLKEIIARAADEDSHIQFTPLALCQELVQKIIDQGISSEKEWLVIANLEILFVVRAWFIYNGWSLDKLHYASASDRKFKFAKCLLGNENVSKYEYDKLKEWDPGMKFDVVLGNPPYQKGLHMKFLELAFNILKVGGFVDFVHPATFFITIKKMKAHRDIVDSITNNIISLELINGNAWFDAGFFVPCSITILRKGYDNKKQITVTTVDGKIHIFKDIDDVNQFGNIPELFSLIEKSQQYPNIWDNRIKVSQKNKKYFVSFSGIRGHISDVKTEMFNKDFWTIVGNHIGVTNEFVNGKFNWSFETPEEAFNFLNYLKTNFARRLLSFYKINGNLKYGELSIIPWLDFTQEWTDEKLFEFFDLTQEEIDFVNLMPKYYK